MTNKQLKFSQQNALQMALDFVNNTLSITDSVLARKYGVTRSTLANIRKGTILTRSYEKYLQILVRVLVGRMRSEQHALLLAKEQENEKIVKLLADMMMVHCSIPTDAEIRRFELHRKYDVL